MASPFWRASVLFAPFLSSPKVITYRFAGIEWTDRNDKVVTLYRYSGKGGYDWGEKSTVHIKKLTRQEAERVILLLERIKFDELVADSDTVANDGTKWIISSKLNVMSLASTW